MEKILLVVLFFLSLSFPVYGKLGVGVATGKIVVKDKLKPGIIYNLPPLSVLNTGDEKGKYEVGVEYHEKQQELRPKESWFDFSPKKFSLKPGEGKKVEIKLNLPIRAKPGHYFAYLEARPIKKMEFGTTSVGIAAAAKLYFTVVPANPVFGIYYKITSILRFNQPWSSRVAIVVGVIALYFILNKYFGFQIGFKRERKK